MAEVASGNRQLHPIAVVNELISQAMRDTMKSIAFDYDAVWECESKLWHMTGAYVKSPDGELCTRLWAHRHRILHGFHFYRPTGVESHVTDLATKTSVAFYEHDPSTLLTKGSPAIARQERYVGIAASDGDTWHEFRFPLIGPNYTERVDGESAARHLGDRTDDTRLHEFQAAFNIGLAAVHDVIDNRAQLWTTRELWHSSYNSGGSL